MSTKHVDRQSEVLDDERTSNGEVVGLAATLLGTLRKHGFPAARSILRRNRNGGGGGAMWPDASSMTIRHAAASPFSGLGWTTG